MELYTHNTVLWNSIVIPYSKYVYVRCAFILTAMVDSMVCLLYKLLSIYPFHMHLKTLQMKLEINLF